MNFLNPLFLIGLAAAALPVIIHLINRRRAVRRRFPAVEFLRRSQKQLARALKVRQRLLLALRVAALLLLPLAMARPYLLGEGEQGAADRLPAGVVFVIDDSASMGWGDGALWARAVERASERLDALRPWDKAALVFASRWPQSGADDDGAVLALTDDLGELREALARRQPSPRGTDLVGGLRAAGELLAGVEVPRKRIVLVTDRQASGLDLEALPAGGFGAPVELLDVRDPEVGPNLAIVDARYTQKSTGARPEFEIEATVQNFGASDARGVEVRLVIEGEPLGAGLLDVPAGKSATKRFTHRFTRKGLHRAELRLASGADPLEADNVRYLPIQLAQKVRALLVNGDPRSVPYQDELFYLERALNPGRSSESVIVTDVTAVEGLAAHPFEDYDVVVLANVEKIPRASVGALTRFVEGGGGLLFVVGDNVKAEAYNSLFGALLPKPLRGFKQLAERDDPDAPLKVARIGQVDESHPIFRVFALPGGETLHSVSTWSYMLVEPTPDGESRVLASWSDGAPMLVERRAGEGRVVLMTTTADRGWTDLPIRTAFLPLTRRLVQHLARRGSSGGAGGGAVVGERVEVEPGDVEGGRYELRDPEGGRVVLAPESAEAGAPLVYVPRLPGHYAVLRSSSAPGSEPQEVEGLAFAANLPVSESDLTEVSAEAFAGALQEAAGGEGAGGAVVDRPEERVGAWSVLLFLVTLVLLSETILGTRRSVLRRLWALARGRAPEVEV